MNQIEFEQLLGAEPRSQCPKFLAEKNSCIENTRKLQDALYFERKLEDALKLPVDDDLPDRILAKIFG